MWDTDSDSGFSCEHDLRHDAETILERVSEETMVIRLTDENSIVPLTRTGFTARHHHFQPDVTNRQWKRYHEHLRYETSWIEEGGELDAIARHISSGWSHGGARESEWISTTTSFHWAIWEISRRLTRLDVDEVAMTLISRHNSYSRFYNGVKDLHINPLDYLPAVPAYRDAINFARSASERLYYGRIFGKNIIEWSTWTHSSTPFDLPDYFFKPSKYWRYDDTWLDKLVWNPWEDTFYLAEGKMDIRDEQLSTGRC